MRRITDEEPCHACADGQHQLCTGACNCTCRVAGTDGEGFSDDPAAGSKERGSEGLPVYDERAWRDYALHLRQVLDQVGVRVPECLPGEPEACGADTPHHCLSYAAALQAKAETGLWHLHHGDPGGARMADQLVQYWRATFAEEDHS